MHLLISRYKLIAFYSSAVVGFIATPSKLLKLAGKQGIENCMAHLHTGSIISHIFKVLLYSCKPASANAAIRLLYSNSLALNAVAPLLYSHTTPANAVARWLYRQTITANAEAPLLYSKTPAANATTPFSIHFHHFLLKNNKN